MPAIVRADGLKLTAKAELFCREYLTDLNATQAAIRAGYSHATAGSIGSALLQKVEVQDFIRELVSKRAERVDITADYVLGTIRDTIERCLQVRPVLDRSGKQVYEDDPDTGEQRPVYQFDSNAVLRGAELLGKYLKLFSDRVEHTGPGGGPVELIAGTMPPDKAAQVYRDMLER